jgi:5-methylcytosine-specific restriction protein A
MKPWPYCSAQGCTVRVPSGRCTAHASLVRQAADAGRDNAAARGYCSTRWRRLRAAKLAEQPWCSGCMKLGFSRPASEVDHLIAHDGPDDALFWQWENLDSKCKPCHSRKTATHDGGFGHARRHA